MSQPQTGRSYQLKLRRRPGRTEHKDRTDEADKLNRQAPEPTDSKILWEESIVGRSHCSSGTVGCQLSSGLARSFGERRWREL